MKPLTDVKSFMKSMNKIYGTYTGIVLDDPKDLFEIIFSIVRKNLKGNIFCRRISGVISCADSFYPKKYYYVKEFEYGYKKNLKIFVEEMINAIPEDVEFIFIRMNFCRYNMFENISSQNTVKLVVFQHSKELS